MRKILIVLGLLVLAIVVTPLALIASGTISASSLRMVLNVITGAAGPAADESTVRQRYQVPEGFSIQLYASDIPRARFMRFTPNGDLLVSRPHEGDILLLRRDENGDGKVDGVETLIENLSRPLGLDIYGDTLYIAESNRVIGVPFDSARGRVTGDVQTIIAGLTDDGNHWSKTLRIGPDSKLYLAQGSTCNVCEESDKRRATMMRFELDGSNPQVIATGLRNSVGFDWAPFNGELYATDNGRDLLGDDFPPCELNQIKEGEFYGWPFFNGDNIADPDMGPDPQMSQRQPVAPVVSFKPHNAPLGITFLERGELPADYERSALVALHGSWNRSSPDGYKVVSLHWSADGIEQRDFLTGFLQGDDISGRPVDVAQGPDGAIYITDDFAGAIYRVVYGKAAGNGAAELVVTANSRLDKEPPAWIADADLPAMSAAGGALYQRYKCAACHENAKPLDNLAASMGYNAVIDALQAPQSPMPAYPLSEEEQRQLAVYLLGR